MIALADCNNFYASCEAVFRPDWRSRPLVVCGNNDGNIIARSASAKELGISMGVAVYQVKPIIERHKVVVCSANFPLYADMSNRVMDILSGFTPRLDVYSIDEAFLDLSAASDATQAASRMRETCRRWTGITLSIGVAPTKTLAKLAAEVAKHDPTGVVSLDDAMERNALLASQPVGEVWGIGRKRAAWLKAHGIETAYELANADLGWLRRNLSVMVQRTALELRGIPCLPFVTERPARQQLCTSRSFGQPIEDFSDLLEAVATFASRNAAKARAQQTQAKALTVFLTTNIFRRHEPQYSNSYTIRLPRASYDTMELVDVACKALRGIYKHGYEYHKAGVVLSNLVRDEIQQMELFTEPPDPRRRELMRVMDAINAQWGNDTLRVARTGTTRIWRMKQVARSPRYTTRWGELAKAH